MKKILASAIVGLLASGGAYAETLPDLGQRGEVSSGSAFNPAISVILDGSYYRDNASGKEESWSEAIEHVAGFVNPHDHDDHDHGELTNGFNLHHAEVLFSASVDNYFDAVLALGIYEDGLEIEEAYGVTRNLPAGLQLKIGKFFSGIGYHNSQHSHDWSFADMALPYQLIFGDHGLNEKGIQLTWIPATDNYTVFGVEALQGENEGMSNYEGRRGYDIGVGASNQAGPRLFTAFAKYAPDLGHDHALQIGLFGGQSGLHQNLHGSRGEEGKTSFVGTDWVYKYDGGGHLGHRNLTLQAEYIYRVRDLEVVGVRTEDVVSHPLGEKRKDIQDVLYMQGVYGIAPRWQTGLRYEVAGMKNQIGRYPDDNPARTDRITANITWHPTEFSKLRLQAARARLAEGREGDRESYNQFYLQYQLALGVHGAHRF